jgi:hypothetical protein
VARGPYPYPDCLHVVGCLLFCNGFHNILFKSEVMLFSRKHERPPILIRIGPHVLSQATTFKYLGVYVKRRCLQRINLLKSVAGVWRAHPSCMLGRIGSVLEYSSVCYAGQDTHVNA